MTFKERTFHLLNDETQDLKRSFLVSYFILGVIVINIIALFLESYKSIYTSYKDLFYLIEVISIIIFSTEYILRVWIADLVYPELSAFRARLKYVFSFMGLVDLIAIIPFYLPFFFNTDLRIIRVFRLFRLFGILKLTRHNRSINMIINVMTKTKNDILSSLFIVLILLIISSTLMFHLETVAQPDQFTDIGQAFWWSIATLTTVGYGDIYPVTGLGKILGSVIALLGIGIVALPTGIISSAYLQELRNETIACNCPHCGKEI